MDYKAVIAALTVASTMVTMADGIVSSSVVGYQAKGFENAQYNITAATFIPVSGDKDGMTLGDFVPNESFVNSTISFMTQGGATARVAFGDSQVPASYVYWADGEKTDAGKAGWYLVDDDDATVCQNDVKIAAGQGFLVYRNGLETTATLTIPSAL